MKNQVKKRNWPTRILRLTAKIVVILVSFLVLVALLLLLPPVQNFVKNKAVTYLEKKLHTKVSVGKIYIGLPAKVVINNFYIEDQHKDTLAYGEQLKVGIKIFKLIFHSSVDVDQIELTNSTLKIDRSLPDTQFNYQFIVDAFSPSSTTKADTTSSSTSISIKKIKLDKIRLVFKDVVSGNNAVAWLNHLDLRIDKIDPDKMVYAVPDANINGVNATIYQYKPLANPEPLTKDLAEASQPINLQLTLDKINLEQIHIKYDNDVSAIHGLINIPESKFDVQSLDLANREIVFAGISLKDANAMVRIGKQETVKVVKQQVNQEVVSRAQTGWRLLVNNLQLDNDSIRYQDENAVAVNRGFDPGNISAAPATLHLEDFVFSDDSISGNITKASFRESKGFSLEDLQANFSYSSTGGFVRNLHVKTPGTEIQRDLEIRYPSIAAAKQNPGLIKVNASLPDSRIAVSDILFFAPFLRSQPAFANQQATWYIDGQVSGAVNDLKIHRFHFRGLSGTIVDLNGSIAGLPDAGKISADLSISNIITNRNDLKLILPSGSLPSNITLPNHMQVSGKIAGDIRGMRTDLNLNSDLGSAKVNGFFKDYSDPLRMVYDADLDVRSLNIGTIIQQPESIGLVSATMHIKGAGTDPKTANAVFEGNLASIVLQGYDYRNLHVKGDLANQLANIEAGMNDPNIDFSLTAKADLSAEYPGIELHAMVDSLKAQALHLTPQLVIYRGNIDANIPVTDPNHLEGNVFLTNTLVINEGQRAQLDSIRIEMATRDTGNFIRLSSPAANAELAGKYSLASLGDIFIKAIQPYYAILPGPPPASIPPYDFELNLSAVNNPLWGVFVPGLNKIEPIQLRSHFSDSGWQADMTAPYIDMTSGVVRNLVVHAGTRDDSIHIDANMDQFTSGTQIALGSTNLAASIAHDSIDFAFNTKDRTAKDKYHVGGFFHQSANGDIEFSLHPQNLLLNYDTWSISEANKLLIRGDDINAQNFILQKDGQSLTLNSGSTAVHSPMQLKFSNFQLATITGFVQADTALIAGSLDGQLDFTNLTTTPEFTGNLTVNNLALQNDTVGNLQVQVNNKSPNTYFADVTLSGRGNDVKVTGNYYPKPVNGNNFDFALNVKELPMANAAAFSAGSIDRASGNVNGQLTIRGTLDEPKVNGALNFDKTGFHSKMLNSYFAIDQEKIQVNPEGISFNDFEIKDSVGNILMVNGTAATNNFRNYKFDMTVTADNFRALNSTKKDNHYFYGQLYFNTNLRITGTESLPIIDGRLAVNDKTKVTIVLPQAEPAVVDREGIVEFVDYSAGVNDSLFRNPLDTLNTVGFTGMDISMNLQLDKAADITLVIDEGNGDFLNLRGDASLSADVDPAGNIILSGAYELDQGSYELSFNLLKRHFDIQKGSRIAWQGEPTNADVDITAIYTVNTAPLDLVKNELSESITAAQRNTYLQKLPFQIVLKMTGQLMKPQISFDIKLPEDKSFQVSNDVLATVDTKLEQLRQEEGEMNKQVFSVLLLNRFVSDNPFTSSGEPTNASAIARQSVSKLLTEQLNQLAADLIKGVDVNFNVQSSSDYTTGSRQDRTDLNVGLSKRLLNDRLTVTVGSNFELEGPQSGNNQSNNIAGNVALDYKVSKDGRYMLRAYRKNEFQDIIDGYVIETGVGFIITVDYNKFKEIFRSRKAREKARAIRRANRQLSKSPTSANPSPVVPASTSPSSQKPTEKQ